MAPILWIDPLLSFATSDPSAQTTAECRPFTDSKRVPWFQESPFDEMSEWNAGRRRALGLTFSESVSLARCDSIRACAISMYRVSRSIPMK